MSGDSVTMRKYLPWVVWTYRSAETYAYAMMRIFCGGIFFTHGFARLFVANPGYGLNPYVSWLTPTGVGILELVCGALLIAGFLTRPAALLLTLLWLLFSIGFTPTGKQTWLMLGAFDHYPAMLFLVSLAILFRGGGRYSLDYRIGREF